MAPTLELVTDEILGMFRDYWLANAPTAAGTVGAPEILFDENRTDVPSTQGAAYVRLSVIHNSSAQRSLGAVGGRRFTRWGSVYANIFTPLLDGAGFTIAQRLAQVARDAYEGRRGSYVWFRHCRLVEKGRDGPYHQINLTADFEWDEVK